MCLRFPFVTPSAARRGIYPSSAKQHFKDLIQEQRLRNMQDEPP